MSDSPHEFVCFGEKELATVVSEISGIATSDFSQISKYSEHTPAVLVGVHCPRNSSAELKILVRGVDDVGYGYLVEEEKISDWTSANDRVRPNCNFCGSSSRSMSLLNSCTLEQGDSEALSGVKGVEADAVNSVYTLSNVENIAFLCDSCYEHFKEFREIIHEFYSAETVSWRI